MGSKVGNTPPPQSLESLAHAFQEVLDDSNANVNGANPDVHGGYFVGKKTKDKCEIDGVARGDVTYLSEKSIKHGPAHAVYRLSGRRRAQHKEASRYLLDLVRQARERNSLDDKQVEAAQNIQWVLARSRSRGYIKMDEIRGNLGIVLEGLQTSTLKSTEAVQKDYGGVADKISHFLDEVETIRSGNDSSVSRENVRKQGEGNVNLLKEIGIVNDLAKQLGVPGQLKDSSAAQLALKPRSFTASAKSPAGHVTGSDLLHKIAGWPGPALQGKLQILFGYAENPGPGGEYFKQACKEVLLELAEQEFILNSLGDEFLNTIKDQEDRERLLALGQSVKKLLLAFRNSDSPFTRLGDLARAGYNLPGPTARELVAKRAEYFRALTNSVPPAGLPPPRGKVPSAHVNGQQLPANMRPVPGNGQPVAVNLQPSVVPGNSSVHPLPQVSVTVLPVSGNGQPPSSLAQPGTGVVSAGHANGSAIPNVPPPPLSAALRSGLYDTEASPADPRAKAEMARLFGDPSVPPAPLDIPPPPNDIPPPPNDIPPPPNDIPPPPNDIPPPPNDIPPPPNDIPPPPNDIPPPPVGVPLNVNLPPPPNTGAAKLLNDLMRSGTSLTVSKIDDGTGHKVVTKDRVLYLKVANEESKNGKIDSLLKKLPHSRLSQYRETRRALKALLENAEIRGLTSKDGGAAGIQSLLSSKHFDGFKDAANHVKVMLGEDVQRQTRAAYRNDVISDLLASFDQAPTSEAQTVVDEFVAAAGEAWKTSVVGEFTPKNIIDYIGLMVNDPDFEFDTSAPPADQRIFGMAASMKNAIDLGVKIQKAGGKTKSDPDDHYVFPPEFLGATDLFIEKNMSSEFKKLFPPVGGFLSAASSVLASRISGHWQTLFKELKNSGTQNFKLGVTEFRDTIPVQIKKVAYLAQLFTDERYLAIVPIEMRKVFIEFGLGLQDWLLKALDGESLYMKLYQMLAVAVENPTDVYDRLYPSTPPDRPLPPITQKQVQAE
ncbi:hypothetical protein [Variovorax sp. WDL1]|uniref:hypothetical protein n=1 Tax=Variovorax sp. WDL1 TaxID=207745 RepID=UPI00076CC629|nr:hypothetical protein [Variovorax sp. WDL1]KWT74120.1 hypothetical protein APY03_5674 [Variovorax sp. WDL1]